MKLRLPKSFMLFGRTIKVKYWEKAKTLKGHPNASWLGLADNRTDDIHIALKTKEGIPRSDAEIMRTFYHELTHWILFELENNKKNNEMFVDKFSKLLHQAITTLKY